MPRLCYALAILLAFMPGACARRARPADPLAQHEYEPMAGDFLFQSLPHNPLIDAIEGCTHSPFSHCGIVVNRGGSWRVIEAIGPVKETPLPVWIVQGRSNAYVAYRLREPLRSKVPEIIASAQRYLGRPYDIHYDLDDEKIYCSELLWKSTRDASGIELGKMQKLGELDWQPHADVIRKVEGGLLPLERSMITPRSVAEDPRLEEVYRWRMK
jgi:hypothetical protein